MESAALYIDEHVAPREDEEQECLRRLEESSEYTPGLLFAPWPAVHERAQMSPAAEWKVMNLRKRPAKTS